MCWQSTSSAPSRASGVSCAASCTASSAARHSRISKRLAGTRIGLRGLVHAMVRAPDALHDARGAFRRADIDDEVDVAPVDAEVEGRGADHGPQPALRHGRLDAPALRHVEGAVMERDREAVLVEVPQRLEHELGLHAGVDEDERRPVPPDEVVDRRHRLRREMAGHRQRLVDLQHADVRPRPAFHDEEVGERLPSPRRGGPSSREARAGWGARAWSSSSEPARRAVSAAGADADRSESGLRSPRTPYPSPQGGGVSTLRHQIPPQIVGLAHGRGESGRGQARREPVKACEAEREQIAALRGDERMQLVETRRASSPRKARAPRDGRGAARAAPGVVSRMSGGRSIWRARLCAGVSPVRVSTRIGSSISRAGASRLRAMSTASAFRGEM